MLDLVRLVVLSRLLVIWISCVCKLGCIVVRVFDVLMSVDVMLLYVVCYI